MVFQNVLRLIFSPSIIFSVFALMMTAIGVILSNVFVGCYFFIVKKQLIGMLHDILLSLSSNIDSTSS